jgi:hypothetical protein
MAAERPEWVLLNSFSYCTGRYRYDCRSHGHDIRLGKHNLEIRFWREAGKPRSK